MKNTFVSPRYMEVTIKDEKGSKKGQLKVKPSTVLWKRGVKGERYYYAVTLDAFIEWITTAGSQVSR